MNNQASTTDTITFLGTAGARFMVSRQLAASGGLWLSLNGTEILLDPGPGSLVQSTKRKLNAEKLSAIILSHRHLDHSADANVMIEAMTNGGFRKRGRFFAPADALDSEPVVFSYLKNYLEETVILEAGKSYTAGKVSFSTPVRHIHPVETYGIVFHATRHTFAYIADTRYFAELARHYAVELLIINMVLTEPRPPVDHLSAPDVARLLVEIKPRIAILSHFGMHVWQAHPWLIAEELSKQTGVKVIAARDGMKFDLTKLDEETTNGQPEI
ncbi:MAG: MBL fold hydrolase [Chloroflexi bacterium RBG_16_56_11]|nr:MAG: MBL fold hydrolase [Chloroflexi bacterium RBG_16_56_11]